MVGHMIARTHRKSSNAPNWNYVERGEDQSSRANDMLEVPFFVKSFNVDVHRAQIGNSCDLNPV